MTVSRVSMSGIRVYLIVNGGEWILLIVTATATTAATAMVMVAVLSGGGCGWARIGGWLI